MFLTVLITVSCDSKVPSADTPRIMSIFNPQSDHNEDKENFCKNSLFKYISYSFNTLQLGY